MLERQNEDFEVLDVGDDRPRFEWRRLRPRELVALAVLVSIGIVAGAGATWWWQQREVERAWASEAHVVGQVIPTENVELSNELCTAVTLQVINAGHRPVTLESVEVDLARLRSSPSCDKPRTTKPVRVAPLGAVKWTVPVQVDCERLVRRPGVQGDDSDRGRLASHRVRRWSAPTSRTCPAATACTSSGPPPMLICLRTRGNRHCACTVRSPLPSAG